MRIALLTLGSRGDVQPYLALARALRAAGHAPVLAASAGFEGWVRRHGAGFARLSFDAEQFFRLPALERAKGSRLRFIAAMRREIGRQMIALLDEFWRACQGAELIIAPPPLACAAYDTLGGRGQPLIAASPQPFLPTGDFPSFFLGAPTGFGRRANRLSQLALEQGFWLCVRPWINRWRRERLGLPPAGWAGAFGAMRRDRVPFLFAYSRHLVPAPADWQPWQRVTGYWFLDEDWAPPPALAAFLERGPPPVYVGFGSIQGAEPGRLVRLALAALERTGQRALLGHGAAGLSPAELPDWAFPLQGAPHCWLFPRMAAAIHHGGAGTTGEALRAGIPSLIAPQPFGSDQRSWARAVERSGAGLRARSLTPAGLAAASDRLVNDSGLRATAARLGGLVRAEDGLGQAMAALRSHLA